MKPETIKTFKVAVTLCLVCSIIVSSLAVGLKSIQESQKEAFRQQSILAAAGLWEDGGDPGALYKANITPVVVDLETNKASDRYEANDKKLELAVLLKDPAMYANLEVAADIAGLKKREAYSVIYEVRDKAKSLQTLVLPIRGRGLWSTLYGFVALDMKDSAKGAAELKIAGLTYYKHGETPGLGGEVDNKLWKAKWPGKLVFDENWDVKVEVSKSATTEFQVDALSGATLTSNGVTNMLRYWLGQDGFGPYLKSLAAGTADETSEAAVDNSVETQPKTASN